MIPTTLRLMRLPGDIFTFSAHDTGDVQRIEQVCIAPKVLQLKLGAQVILVKNRNDKLVNGSLIPALSFDPSSVWVDKLLDPLLNHKGSTSETVRKDAFNLWNALSDH